MQHGPHFSTRSRRHRRCGSLLGRCRKGVGRSPPYFKRCSHLTTCLRILPRGQDAAHTLIRSRRICHTFHTCRAVAHTRPPVPHGVTHTLRLGMGLVLFPVCGCPYEGLGLVAHAVWTRDRKFGEVLRRDAWVFRRNYFTHDI